MGRRVYFLIGLIVALHASVKAQNALDSLHTLLTTTIDDSTRVDVNLAISLSYYNLDLKQSLQFGQAAIQLANDINYQKGIQEALSVLSRIHRRLGNFSVAIDYNLQEIAIAEKRKDVAGVIDGFTTLGNIHSSLENYQEARTNLYRAYQLASRNRALNLSAIMNFIGRNYGKMMQYDSAHHWIDRALEQELKLPQPGYTLSYIYNNKAEIYLLQKDHKLAVDFYHQAEALPMEKTSPFGRTFTYNGIAQAFVGLGRYKDAIDAIQKSNAISIRYGYRDKTKESYRILYDIYERMGKYDKALENYKLFNLYQDSIFSEDRMHHIENLKINFETERMEHENELLRKDAELKDARIGEQKSYTIIAIILAVSLTGAFIFLYYSYRQNKQRSRLLSDYNTNLEKQVERRTQELVKSNLELIRQNNQLEQFAFITAHNLRAPVARILGLANVVDLHTFDPIADKHLLESFKVTAEQLDGIIHDLNAILDIKKGSRESFEVVDFNERLVKIRNLLREPIEGTHAKVEADFSQVKSCFAIPAYIESILYNLVSNSLKYRSPDRQPQVTIQTSIQDKNLELMVKDNGIGMDMNRVRTKLFNLYQRFHLDIEGRGMGLFLVKTQVEAMHGTIEVDSEPNQGTTFRILIPLATTNKAS